MAITVEGSTKPRHNGRGPRDPSQVHGLLQTVMGRRLNQIRLLCTLRISNEIRFLAVPSPSGIAGLVAGVVTQSRIVTRRQLPVVGGSIKSLID